jgi:hypothetical protein
MYGASPYYERASGLQCIREGLPMYRINLSASLLKMRPNYDIMRANFITMRPSLLDTLVAG